MGFGAGNPDAWGTWCPSPLSALARDFAAIPRRHRGGRGLTSARRGKAIASEPGAAAHGVPRPERQRMGLW